MSKMRKFSRAHKSILNAEAKHARWFVTNLARLVDRITASPNYVFDFGIAARTLLPLLLNVLTLFEGIYGPKLIPVLNTPPGVLNGKLKKMSNLQFC